MPSEQEFQKQLKRRERHSLRFVIRCDVVNPELIEREPYHGWRATISAAPPDGLFLQTLVVTPHSTGGRKLCAALNAGDILHSSRG